jgi:hypothetical protein
LLLGLASVLAGAAPAAGAPLEALRPGQVVVSLGQAPEWFPLSGQPIDVTVFAGRPRATRASSQNVYVEFQRADRGCPASPGADHRTPLVARAFFSRSHLLSRRSPFTPDGGAATDVHAMTLGPLTLHQTGSTRACVWLGRSTRTRDRLASPTIPLLNRAFAAAVSDLPQPGGATPAYTLTAVAGFSFAYAATTLACGERLADPGQPVAATTPVSEAVAPDPNPCAGDGTTFVFSSPGRALPQLRFTAAQAQAGSAVVVHAGGCELDAIDAVPEAAAAAYVQADGCTVAGTEISPYSRSLPRGAVLYAMVDGGIASLAPAGTPVDLVLNG